jgi:hypothetical protein
MVWGGGGIGWRDGKIDIQEGVEVVGRLGGHFGHGGLVTIPTGAKTLKLEMAPSQEHQYLVQAGFITRHPGVARSTICLP